MKEEKSNKASERRKNNLEFKMNFEPLYIELTQEAEACYKALQVTPYNESLTEPFSKDVYFKSLWDKAHTYYEENSLLEPCEVKFTVANKTYTGILYSCSVEHQSRVHCGGICSECTKVYFVKDEGLDIEVGSNIEFFKDTNKEDTNKKGTNKKGTKKHTLIVGGIVEDNDLEAAQKKEKKKIILGNKKTFCGLFDSLDYDVLFEDEIWKTVVELKNSLKDVQRNTKSNSSLRSDDVFYWYPLWCETALYFAESVNVEKNIWRRYLPKKFPFSEEKLGKECWFSNGYYQAYTSWFDRGKEKKNYQKVVRFLFVLLESAPESRVDNFLLFEYRTRLLSCMFGIDNINTLGMLRDAERRGWLRKGTFIKVSSEAYLSFLLSSFESLLKEGTESKHQKTISEKNEKELIDAFSGGYFIPFDRNLRRNFDVAYLLTGHFAAEKEQRAFWSDMLILLWARPSLYELIKNNHGTLPDKSLLETESEEVKMRFARIVEHKATFEEDFKNRIDQIFNYEVPQIEVDENGDYEGGMFNEFPEEEHDYGLLDLVAQKALSTWEQNDKLLYHTLRYLQMVFPDEKYLHTGLLKWEERVLDIKKETPWYDWLWSRWQKKN